MTERSSIINADKIDSFESLRGLMAIWVLIGHVMLTFNTDSLKEEFLLNALLENGRAVYVFMILSGFVIFFLLHTKNEGYLLFIYRRFLRIFPAYIVALLISAAMLPISLEAISSVASMSNRNISRVEYLSASINNFLPHLTAHLTLLHGLIPTNVLPFSDWAIMGQAWSISVEWQFYLLAPIYYSLLKTKISLFSKLFFIILSLLALYFISFKFGYSFIGKHLLYFLIGCASAIFWLIPTKWHYLFLKYPNLTITITTTLCIIITPDKWEISIWVLIYLSALIIRDKPDNKSIAYYVNSIMKLKPLRYLGKISYSIYLAHMIPLFLAIYFFNDLNMSSSDRLLTTLSSTFILTIALAAFLYHFIEAPFIDFGRKGLPNILQRYINT
ncbi:MAG: acyltransferase [Rhodocyclaceae bacterium]|jgi:peptidoglycan/LPS O-acetylase OafA/YrhL|nr:acyltransferase [Rhodocyclaceae bacterium]